MTFTSCPNKWKKMEKNGKNGKKWKKIVVRRKAAQ